MKDMNGLDLKVGDTVRVMRRYNRCTDPEWSNIWGGLRMDSAIGKLTKVRSIVGDNVKLSNEYTYDYNFPGCVLMKVEPEPPLTVNFRKNGWGGTPEE